MDAKFISTPLIERWQERKKHIIILIKQSKRKQEEDILVSFDRYSIVMIFIRPT